MTAFDPRTTPARADLAARFLEGKIAASRYAEGEICDVIDALAPVRRDPTPDAPLLTEALRGEHVTIYERDGEGWAWGQLESDGYVGFMPANALAPPGASATHKVAALRTLVFPAPSIKAPPVDALPLGARLAIAREQDAFAVTANGLYVPARHLQKLAAREADFVAVAERFVGTPYLWGGKTSLGLDCSGLVQVALGAAGIACPRDSDMQERAVGTPLPFGAALPPLHRGDLVFWRGHVAIVRDPATLVHANAFHMAVAVEPIDAAVARIRAAGAEVASIRRI